MPATPESLVAAIVEQTDQPEVSFPALLAQIHASQFTGPVTFHFHRGTPQAIEIPRSLTLKLAKT